MPPWHASLPQGGAVTGDPGTTNQILFSQDLDNGDWAESNVTVVANGATAPDGTNTADKINETATTGNHLISQGNFTFADNAVALYSAYLRASERSWMTLEVAGKDAASIYCNYDLTNGVIGAGGVNARRIATGMTALAGGWYRCWIAANVGAGASAPGGRIYLSTGNDVFNYAGTAGSGALAWGVQMEADTATHAPTDYQPTASAAVTRPVGPCVNGAGQRGVSLVTHGWSGGTALKAGDLFQVATARGQQMAILTQDVTADLFGNATLAFRPKLRSAPSDGALIVTASPSPVWMLADDHQGSLTMAPGLLGSLRLNLAEAAP
jgi:hypothetical protein